MNTETDSWSVFGDTTSADDTLKAGLLEPLAEEYAGLKSQSEVIAERLGQLENEIAHFFPQEFGELAKSTQKFEVIVSRSERWAWDKVALDRQFNGEILPDHVKRTLTVDKRKFQRLPPAEQDALRPALTRKMDKPRVKVIPHV